MAIQLYLSSCCFLQENDAALVRGGIQSHHSYLKSHPSRLVPEDTRVRRAKCTIAQDLSRLINKCLEFDTEQ